MGRNFRHTKQVLRKLVATVLPMERVASVASKVKSTTSRIVPSASRNRQATEIPVKRLRGRVVCGLGVLLLLGSALLIASSLPMSRSKATSWSGLNPATTADQARGTVTPQGSMGKTRFALEYQRHLDRVVMSVPAEPRTLEFHEQLLVALPEYTQVELLAPAHRLAELRQWVRKHHFPQTIRWHRYSLENRDGEDVYCVLPDETGLVRAPATGSLSQTVGGTFWAQDLFECVSNADGGCVLLLPRVYRYLYLDRRGSTARWRGDTQGLSRVEPTLEAIHSLPLAFKGGNIVADCVAGRRLLFVGYDVVTTTRVMCKAFGQAAPPAKAICELLAQWFAVDEVVVVPERRPQPVVMYHLDQAMLPLGENVVAVPRVVGERPRLEPAASRIRSVSAFLDELCSVLRQKGYRIVFLDTPVAYLLKRRHFVNAIAYHDRRTGRPTMLLPSYSRNEGEFTPSALFETNRRRLEDAGYDVVCVPTTADRLFGGIHCLVEVLQ